MNWTVVQTNGTRHTITVRVHDIALNISWHTNGIGLNRQSIKLHNCMFRVFNAFSAQLAADMLENRTHELTSLLNCNKLHKTGLANVIASIAMQCIWMAVCSSLVLMQITRTKTRSICKPAWTVLQPRWNGPTTLPVISLICGCCGEVVEELG